MHWEFSMNGKPADVACELSKYGETLEGPARSAFDEAAPSLLKLVGLNSPSVDIRFAASEVDVGDRVLSVSLYELI